MPVGLGRAEKRARGKHMLCIARPKANVYASVARSFPIKQLLYQIDGASRTCRPKDGL